MSWNRNSNQNQEEMGLTGKPIRFGIVGMNQHAEKFYQANRFSRNIEFVTESDSLDAAFVCSDRRSRFSDCLTLLNAGKHVLCEPPMAESVEQIQELYQAAEENEVMLMEGIPTIYTPAFEKMIPYMDSLGKIRHATFHNCRYSAAYEQKRFGLMSPEFNPELNGGAIMELGVYPVAFMIRLFGAPKRIHAAGVSLSNGMNTTGTILMEYEEMIGEAIYSKISDSAMPSQIQGEEGSMLIHEIDNIKDLRISRRKVDQVIHFEQSDNIYQHVTNAFVQMIRTCIGMDKNREISLETMKVLEQAMEQMGLRQKTQE